MSHCVLTAVRPAIRLGSFVFVSLWVASAAQASLIPIVNADFETILNHTTSAPVTTVPIAASTSGTFTNSAFVNNNVATAFNVDIPGWTSPTGAGAGIEKLGSLVGPTDTTNMGYVGMFNTSASSFSQTLGTNFDSHAIYTLSLEVYRRSDQSNTGTGATDFPLTFAAGLKAGGTALAATGAPIYSTPAPLGESNYSITFNGSALANAGNSGPLSILFSTGSGQVNIDNVTLTATAITPEPSSLVLAGTVLMGLGLIVCRRTRPSRS
jgi:hypothetical protein